MSVVCWPDDMRAQKQDVQRLPVRRSDLLPCASFGYDLYHRDLFKQPAKIHMIDGWVIEYMAMCTAENQYKTPIVIIGGAFQNFNSYKYCVEQLLNAGPVILIDLPSMGSNRQLNNSITQQSAAELELPDLAHYLGRWVVAMQLPKISIMGMSLGSVVAAHFAEQFPQHLSRLVLMGVMQKTRPSWRMLLQESLSLMQENRMDEFGQAVVLYLINHARLGQTRLSPTAKRLFFKQMAGFANTERARYEMNCSRLLRLDHVPIPHCETLVAVGEFDSFTLPFENADFALQCPNMQFALIENADHLPQLQRRQETMQLFSTFLQQQPIAGLAGIRPLSRAQMGVMERRGEPRLRLCQPQHRLLHRQLADWSADVRVVDINFFGVLLDTGSVAAATALIADSPRQLLLQLQTADGADFLLGCLIFEQQGALLRALFQHGDFDRAEQLNLLLASAAVQR